MAIKKSELYSTLWRSCDELRGGMDSSQYKDYVLVMLFVKYVSDKAKNNPDFLIEVPAETSVTNISIYDPTCGSGSLLLKAWNEAPNPDTTSLWGQEYDINNVGLSKMNMILHGYTTSDIKQGDTLNNPQHKDNQGNLKTFDFVVANPPFSQKSWLKSAKENDEYERWNIKEIGVPPEKNGDFAFLLHIIRSLKSKGKGACILPHGVLFRGNAEAGIRKYVLERGYIKGIIGLPPNLFFGTGIPACIIVLDKEEAAGRKGIFMIDAKAGFIKDGNKNRLREQDIRRIVDTWEAQKDVLHYAKFVGKEELAKNDYNLNLPRYIDSGDEEVLQDIEAHLKGGIPEHDIEQLYHYWDACPGLKDALFAKGSRDGYFQWIPQKQAIRDCITEHPAFTEQYNKLFTSYHDWSSEWLPVFENLSPNSFKPKVLIEQMGNSVLKHFSESLLVDKYDVYDQLMNYWLETMQDDFYLIEADGWKVKYYTPQPTEKKKEDATKSKKAKEAKTIHDIACDLLPVNCIVDEYFPTQKEQIARIEELISQTEASIAELCEEFAEDYLNPDEFTNGKISAANAKKRLKEVTGKEAEVVKKYLRYHETIGDYKKQLKEEHSELLTNVLRKYTSLPETEIKRLVTNKWTNAFGNRLAEESQRISQSLNSRLIALAERYEETLPQIHAEVEMYEAKVMEHLAKMGFEAITNKKLKITK